MSLKKTAGSRFSIRHLIAGLALTLGVSAIAHAASPSTHDKPVEGMDCTPVTLAVPGTAAGVKAPVKKLTAEQLAKANAEYKKLTPAQREAKDKAFIAARAAKEAAWKLANPGIPASSKTVFSCVQPQVPGAAPVPGLPRVLQPETPQNFTPNPNAPPRTTWFPPNGHIPSTPIYPLVPGTPGTPGVPGTPEIPTAPTDPTNPCTSFHDMLKDDQGKYIDSRVENAWKNTPRMAKHCEIPEPPTPPVVVPPVITPPTEPPVVTPPTEPPVLPPGVIDCRDYTNLPPDRKPVECQPVHNVPEPGSLALAFIGLAGLVWSQIRKKPAAQSNGPKL